MTGVRPLSLMLLRLTAGGALIAFPGNATVPGDLPPDLPPPSSTTAIPTPPLLWPTDAGTVVTSTFGEYRPAHFHAGIDISTGDLTRYRVFAVLDGDVRRATITATGYGKIIRLRHADGSTSAYAHLSEFAAPVEERVRAEQHRLGSYPIDLRFPPGDIRVRRGDLIGYSGDTGIGTPHLHFELADTGGSPVNPLLVLGGALPDSLPPSITRLAVVPLAASAEVDGGWEPGIYRVRPSGPGKGTVRDHIAIAGPAGFLVEARDPGPGTRFRRGVFRYRLLIDDREVYAVTMNRLPRPYPYQVGLHFDRSLPLSARGRFERLFSYAGPQLPIGSPSGAGSGTVGVPGLSPGLHRFTVVAEDVAGNSSRVNGEFLCKESLAADVHTPWIPLGRGETDGRLQVEATSDGEYVTVVLTSAVPLDHPPRVGVTEGPACRVLQAQAAGTNRFATRFTPLTAWSGIRRIEARGASRDLPVWGSTEISLYPIDPRGPGTLALWGGELRLAWDSAAIYRPTFLQCERTEGSEGRQYLVEPEATVIRSHIRVSIRPPVSDSTAGLYYRGVGSWVLLGRYSEGCWQGELRERFGELAVLPDTAAPIARRIHISGGSRPRIAFWYRDDRAGVDYGEVKLYIDSIAVIPELDGEHRRAVYEARERYAAGIHEVIIHLADRMGNTRSIRQTFSVP